MTKRQYQYFRAKKIRRINNRYLKRRKEILGIVDKPQSGGL